MQCNFERPPERLQNANTPQVHQALNIRLTINKLAPTQQRQIQIR